MENPRFKFRVWNNKHNRYIVDSHYPIGSDHSIVIKQDGRAYNLGLGDYEDYSNMHSWAVMEEFTDCILEQCTGLKDKNGNLIYEGDIVRHSYSGKGVVSFGKYTGCFAAGWENIYVDLFGWYLDDYYEPDDCGRLRVNLDNTHDSITEEDASDFEIIGNVHEQA